MKLKKANGDDVKEKYNFITNQPKEENGFCNEYYQCNYDEFANNILPSLIDHSKGINLKENYVPDSYYFLWDGDKIVGLYKIRHYLNEFLANGPGHIGYGITKEFRYYGYGTIGLQLAIIEASKIILEDGIYLSVHKDNLASLKVQLKNGAYIHHEDEKEYYTRIKKIKALLKT